MALELNQLNDYETFQVVPDGEMVPRGYKRIPYHIVFDVKFDGRLKSRLVAGGHRTPDVLVSFPWKPFVLDSLWPK